MQSPIQSQPTIHSITWRTARRFVLPMLLLDIGVWLLFQALLPVGAAFGPTTSHEHLLLQTTSAPLSASAAYTSTFTPKYFGDPNKTNSIAVGDMNGDGALDIIQGNYDQPSVVYLNDRHGGFSVGAPFGGANWTSSIAVGDMNGDGALDIIQGNDYGQPSMVYLNDGHGGFSAGVPFGNANNTFGIAVGDMNGDGTLDIIQANCVQPSMVYLNDGRGGFGTGVPFGAPKYTYSVAVGDVNGDGALDIVQGTNLQSIVYLNDGHGGFGVGVPFGNTNNTQGIVVLGDVNGDGALDIVQGNRDLSSVVYLNDGHGSFGTGVPFGDPNKTNSIAVGDVNGDGALDIIQGNDSTQSVVYLNDGHGAFGGTGVPFGGANYTAGIALGDMNGDGALDIIQGNYGQQSVVYLNDGHGGLGMGVQFGGANQTHSIAVGDVNGDGALDIIQGNSGQSVVYLNDGTGGFSAGVQFGGANWTHSIAVGDVNGDGALDIIQGNWDQQSVMYLNDGHGDFGTGVQFGGANWTYSIAVGDVNGDGALDIIQGNWDQQSVMYLNDGHGNFGAGVPFGGANWTTSIAAGDVNGDGALDIIQGNGVSSNPQQSVVYLNDGHGGFGAGVPYGSANETASIAVGDVNGDGALDIIQGNYDQPSVVYLNDGHGGFGARLTFGDLNYTMSIAVGDVNGDGALDIIQDNRGASVAYLNDGHGGFRAGTPFGGANWTWSIALGDVNGDGVLDIIQDNAGSQSVVYLNTRFQREGLPNNPPTVIVTRPGRTGNANFFSASDILSSTIIPITYTLSDPEGDPMRLIRAYYSPDGGGRWLPAIASTNTLTTNLGSLGTGLAFDGVDDYASTSNLVGLATGNVSHTIEAWIKISSLPAYRAWIMVLGNSGFGAHYWLLNHDGTTQFGVWDSGAQTAQLHPVITPGVWTHVAMTFDGTTLRGYVNGQLIGSTAAAFDLEGVPLNLAQAHAGENYFAGMLDEVRVWNVARTQAQIQASMQQVLTGSVPGLVAYWRFNEGQGNTAFDQTPQHNTGTLVNGPSWTSVAFPYVYYWDTFASGFFGQSDNVVFRIEAYPSLTSSPNGVPVFQHPYASSTTFPFRVRGTQVRVLSQTEPISNAIVYRLPAEQSGGGEVMADAAGKTFPTDDHGYLQGRGELRFGDQLLALVPVSSNLKYEGVVQLDGLDDYVIKNPLNAAPITETTISFWMRSDDLSGQGTPVSYATSNDADEFLITNYNNLTIYRGNNISVTTGITATDGEWHYLAVTWRGADGQVKLYKDGVAAYTGTLTTTSMLTGGSVVLGQDQGNVGGSFDPARAFKGDLDEVHVWDVALDEARIQADMLQPPGSSAPGLVLDWTFDAPIGDTVDDQSGHDNAGTLIDAVWNSQSFGGYTVYHTSGVPTENGLNTYTVTQAGVQTLVVTATHPLILFDLDVSLEWDAHNDPSYLPQLTADLQRASAYLYDFSDGQIALGHVRVHQNADDWLTSQVVINATNRLRPLAVQGGSVTAPITDPQHSNIVYSPGQVHMGSTWNRYGEPGGTTGSDWPLALAHELSHYLLFQEDAYLGVDSRGLLIPVGTCAGSVMGDMYDPSNTEFVFDETHWNNDCADTLANRTLGRTEWATNRLWYPSLVTPTIVNTGPALMPFDWTTVTIFDPITPTNALADPTFFIRYQAAAVSSSEARAFLLRTDTTGQTTVIDVGSPLGGQNRVLARGAQPGDRLCIFDQPRRQYGCEVIQAGDYELDLEHDETWTPVIQISPVNSQTIAIAIDGLTSTLPLRARLYPSDGYGGEVITLTQSNNLYTGTFYLDFPAMMGYVQVWVDETDTEANPRREAMVNYSMSGNPGNWPLLRGGWPLLRGGWPLLRGGWPLLRGGWSASRGSSAPLASPGGQMLFFTPDPASIEAGNLYTIQSMAGLPPLPAGKTAVGQGYSLIASPNVTQVITGSISFQYMSIDILVEQADENQLTIHYWDGQMWQALDTTRSPYFNMASAPSHGPGIYALLAGVTTPQLDAIDPPAAINDVTTTLAISGHDFLSPIDVRLIGPTTTYTLPVVSVSPISITAIITPGLPAHEYQVMVVNHFDAPAPSSLPFALYDPAAACFYDFFESGESKWQRSGTWDIITMPNGNQALTDSPGGSYGVTVSPTLTATTSITSSAFNLGGCPNPVLTFRHDYVIDNRPPSQDWGRVEISTDNGVTWRELARYAGGLRTSLVSSQNARCGLSNPQQSAGFDTLRAAGENCDRLSLRKLAIDSEWVDAQWEDVEIDLSAYTGTVRLRFGLEFDRVGADRGWVIDDVMVYSKPRSNKVFLPVVLKGWP